MNLLQVLLAGCLMGVLLAMNEPKLPQWNAAEREPNKLADWAADGVLLAEQVEVGEPEIALSIELEVPPPTADDLAGDANPAPEIAEEFLPAYFAERPQAFLVDPQKLLGPIDYRARLDFLNYHAGDSSVDLFVYLIGGDQQIPSEVREEEVVERFFSMGRPAVLVYYYLGAPQRAVIYLSPTLTDFVSVSEQRRALESSVMQAGGKTDASAQFESFLVQMSIRVYWMERMVAGEPEVFDQTVLGGVPVVAAPAGGGFTREEKFQELLDTVMPYLVPVSVIFGFLLAAIGVNFWLRMRATYRFPEYEIEPRLGAAHAAGVGAVISFASASVPPASQRDQVPEYLRRA